MHAGVALGDAVLRGLMSTSFVDLVFLEQEMQLAVRDAVETASVAASKRREADGGETDHTQAGILILDTYPSKVRRWVLGSFRLLCRARVSASALERRQRGVQGNTLKQADSTQRARTAAKLKIIDVEPKHTLTAQEELPKAFTRISLDDDR